jgi:hypothetical protein
MIISGHGGGNVNVWDLKSNKVKTKRYESFVNVLTIYNDMIITGHVNGGVNVIQL